MSSIVKPVVDGSENQWGQILNDALDSLNSKAESAIAGLAQKADVSHGHLEYVKTVAGKTPSAGGNIPLVATDITGLDQVDNTRDVDKPVSALTQQAINQKVDVTDPRLSDPRTPVAGSVTGDSLSAALQASIAKANASLDQTAVDARVQTVVGAAPAALDTLVEFAAALGSDPNFAATITTALGTKVGKTGNETIAGTKTFSSAPAVPDNSFAQAKVTGLTASLNARLVPRGAYAIGTAYAVNDVVTYYENDYRCTTAHTSATAGPASGSWACAVKVVPVQWTTGTGWASKPTLLPGQIRWWFSEGDVDATQPAMDNGDWWWPHPDSAAYGTGA